MSKSKIHATGDQRKAAMCEGSRMLLFSKAPELKVPAAFNTQARSEQNVAKYFEALERGWQSKVPTHMPNQQ
eukprot:1157179-Pelagomonas_calceolata.AAC.13